MERVLLEKEGPIGWLILNHPEKRNALSLEMIEGLLDKLAVIQNDGAIRVVVIRGNGPVFSAGHDIREMSSSSGDLHAVRKIFTTCNRMMLQLHELSQPVIAMVHGIATAAGCQLVAACDLAIAETGARFATPGVKIGLFCTTPMVPLVRVIGRRRAMDMLLTGRFVSAEEAEHSGLLNRVVPADRLVEETRQWDLDLSQASPFTLALGKRAFYEQVDLAEKPAYDYAKEVISMNCMEDDAVEGMTAFIEKRKPVWRSR